MGRPSKGGVNVVRKRLADGTFKEYRYAKDTVVPFTRLDSRETVDGLIDLYLDSSAFQRLEPRTQFDYAKHLKKVPLHLRRMTFVMLSNKREALSAFADWREDLAKTAGRQTNLTWRVINIALNYAVGRGKIDFNPLARCGIKPEPEGNRAEMVWDDIQLAALNAAASPEVRLVMWTAFWTSQRQGDLLRMPWSAYDGDTLTFVQNKKNVAMKIPVAGPLKALLDATPRKSPIMFVSEFGVPWTERTFRSRWRKSCKAAKVANSAHGGVTFHDLRGTAITRMSLAGCTMIEIANISGHGLTGRDAPSSLSKYIKRDVGIARNAIAKFEAYEAGQKGISNRAQPIDFLTEKTARSGKNS